MNKTYHVLEYTKILERLAGFTASEQVQARILALEPYKTLPAAKRAQQETTEAVSALLRQGSPPVSLSVAQISGSVRRASAGGSLQPRELLEVSRVLYVARRMKTYLKDTGAELELLYAAGEALLPEKTLEDQINTCILSEAEIADDASGDLAAIRRKMRNLNGKIKDTLNTMIRSEHYKKYLQDPIVTMRADRYVIPVRAEYRGEVHGIVHDTSASGATLFIEPMSVVNANNEIRDLQNKEEQEIERILAALSAAVADAEEVLLTDYALLQDLDFYFAKGKLSLEMNAREPELNAAGVIALKRARHPLIDPKAVVANDIYLGDGYDTLVITGPNTGGKTVTLKTLGLFSLMAAAGLHLPTADNSRAAVFSHVYADIGDEQSIEQSLSTFSAHMVNIVDIINHVDENSLALFDELGAGTDPTEGAALAIAVLEHLRAFGAKTAATTHYSELKLFALSTAGVENASCEFDVESLQPTYKLLIGIPGKSNAFAISKRLGLSDAVIGRANELLSDESVKFEDVISELETNRAKAQAEKDYAQRMRRELADLKTEIERERKTLKENKARILEEARREAKILIMDAKDEANAVIKDLERMRQQGARQDLDAQVQQSRAKLKQKEDTIDAAMQKAQKPRKVYHDLPKNLKAGDTVRIVSMNQEATVLKPPGKDGNVRVQAGIIKMDVHLSNLERVADQSAKKLAETYVRSTGAYRSKAKNVSTQVDVRGQNLEEALMNVEKFLDDCYMAGISPVTIIHGKGTGILKNGIHEMLRRHKYAKSYRLGRYGEGENGVTVVELK